MLQLEVDSMLARTFGVSTIMLSGDPAACEELHALVRQAE